jgi:hypothetical protein
MSEIRNLVNSNPQLVRGNLGNWRVKRVGHGTAGSEDTQSTQNSPRATANDA